MENHVGIGGAIDNDEKSNAQSWAIYILRYINFSSVEEYSIVNDIAADNAVYRRDDILKYQNELVLGFWEPTFHELFKKTGEQLLFEPNLRVIHKNLYGTKSFCAQRIAHGCAFGVHRGSKYGSLKLLMMIFLSPLIPLVFFNKLFRAANSKLKNRRVLYKALPYLIVFLCAWAIGEAKGYFKAICYKKGKFSA